MFHTVFLVTRAIHSNPKDAYRFKHWTVVIFAVFCRRLIRFTSIYRATIVHNYSTFWTKLPSSVVAGPPAEEVTRGATTGSFQVSLSKWDPSNRHVRISLSLTSRRTFPLRLAVISAKIWRRHRVSTPKSLRSLWIECEQLDFCEENIEEQWKTKLQVGKLNRVLTLQQTSFWSIFSNLTARMENFSRNLLNIYLSV